MNERRKDPRTDTCFSLRNLLRVRALEHCLSLAVLSTTDGMLLAGSREDRPAQRAAAHSGLALTGPSERFERLGRRTDATVSGLRFNATGGPLCLTVLSEGPRIAAGMLEELARRVRAILLEGRMRQAA